MPSSIPEHKIDEVREATDIVDLVSGYVTLKKSGSNFFGLCPFHTEKTPSFSVHPEKQIFRCFGCGAGGNAFTYLMRHEGISFVEAVKFLAQKAGIHLDFTEQDQTAAKENEALYYVNEIAARYFHESLLGAAGKQAMQYLKNRGFRKEEIKTFDLGYAPGGWEGLIDYSVKESVKPDLLMRAGLILKKTGGGHYDRFRDRVMFTIRNLSGKVVAFGGRKLNNNEEGPKYVNSPETNVYEKGKLLYGLFQNRDEIRKRDRAVFVEGYTDLMSLVSNGIKNVAATLGTSLTQEQARLIRRYTRNVVLMYDSDTAGSAAALRGADILLENDVQVWVCTLPEGSDPDSLITEKGGEWVAEYLSEAPDLFDFRVEQLLTQPLERRGDDVRALLQSLSKLKDNLRRSMLVRKVSEKIEMDERILWDELQSLVRQQNRSQPRRPTIGQRLNDLSKTAKISKTEAALADLVRILIHKWDLSDLVFENLNFNLVEGSKQEPILKYLRNRHKGGKRPRESDLLNGFHDIELTSFIVNTLADQLEGLDFERWTQDCLLAIEKEKIQTGLNAVREEMRDAQKRGQPVKDLLQRCMELEADKKSLEAKSHAVHGEIA